MMDVVNSYMVEDTSGSVSSSEMIFSSPEALMAADSCRYREHKDQTMEFHWLYGRNKWKCVITWTGVACSTPSGWSNGDGCASKALESSSSKVPVVDIHGFRKYNIIHVLLVIKPHLQTFISHIGCWEISFLSTDQSPKPPAVIVFVQHMDHITAAYRQLIRSIGSVLV